MTVETISHKLKRLSAEERLEVEDFIEFLLTKAERNKTEGRLSILAEEGMGGYLANLESYEEKLAAGEIRW